MKKNHYIYILAATALTLGACSSDKDVIDEEIANAVPQEGEAMTFSAASVGGLEYLAEEDLDGTSVAAKPRTIDINTDGTDMAISQWYTNDKISISDGTLNYTFSPSSTDANCTFTPGGKTFLGESNKTFYAFYPKEAALSWNESTVTAMVWTEQLYSENAPGSGVLGPYIAASATTSSDGATAEFKFGYICSVIDVDLSTFDGGTIQSVSLLSNSGASMAGRVRYNYETKAIQVVNNDAAGYAAQNCISNLVTVSDVNASTATVRFYVLPVTQDNGFTITVRTTDGNFYTKKSTTKVGNSAINTDYISGMSNQAGNVCLPYYKKYKFGTKSSATQNLWMATIPNNLRLRQLTMPGAHNAATKNCGSASKCQSEDIAGLLANGVRGFDLRPTYMGDSESEIQLDNLKIYHGMSDTGIKFKDAIATLVSFVQSNPSEVIFINMQKEYRSKILGSYDDYSSTWRTSIRSCFQNYGTTVFLETLETYQNFGDARGKIVVISKNPYGSESNNWDFYYGGVVRDWGDNAFTENAVIYKVNYAKIADASVEDSYQQTNTSSKQELVQTMLEKAANDSSPRFFFTWNNIAWVSGTTYPSNYASTMNPWLTGYINNTAPAERLGYIYADFIGSSSNGGAALLKAIIQHNHKYVYKGRTRKTTSGGTGTGANVAGDEYADDSEVFAKER